MADESLTDLGRNDAQGFEICLRQRRRGGLIIDELVVNGAFAMDSADHSSEDALADLAPVSAHEVLVGGLGMGFTADRVLARCPQARVTVVELSSALIEWAHQAATATLGRVAAHPRVRLVQADVAHVMAAARPASFDAVLLDVDNGPDYLIHPTNADLYGATLIEKAASLVAPDGVLAIWCQRASPELATQLQALPGESGLVQSTVTRDAHELDYAIHTFTPRMC